MDNIELNQISFSPNSVMDGLGRVFEYHNKIYRLINESQTSECLEFINSELFKKLIELEYIPQTKIADDITIVNSNLLILEHERCPDIRLHEWSFEMYKSATVHFLKVKSLCNQHGYELKDGHLANITFKNCKPIFIDLGSFTKQHNVTFNIQEFFESAMLPLLLWQQGEYFVLRSIISDNFHGSFLNPKTDSIDSNILEKSTRNFSSYRFKCLGHFWEWEQNHFKWLIKKTNTIIRLIRHRNINYHFITYEKKYRLPSVEEVLEIKKKHINTDWESYHYVNIKNDFNGRFNRIITLVKEKCQDAKTAIDIAGNQGALCEALSKTKLFEHLFLVDYDENAIDKAFCNITKEGEHQIDTVFSNCILPLFGPSDIPRLQSDIAFALALTHHLVLSQNFHISLIFERIALYSKKYVFVEFMPLGLWDGQKGIPYPEWYNENWFQQNFELFFTLIHKEQLEQNRILFIGVKKRPAPIE